MDGGKKREIRWILCPVTGERARVDVQCVGCNEWDGEMCGYDVRRPDAKRRIPRFRKGPAGKRGGGGGVRVPLVWDKWPRRGYGDDSMGPDLSGDADYGVTDLEEEGRMIMDKMEREKIRKRLEEKKDDPDYHDPILPGLHEESSIPDVEVTEDVPGDMPVPGTANPFDEPFPSAIPDFENPFDKPFPSPFDGYPGAEEPGGTIPGMHGPDMSDDGGKVG